MKRILMLLPAVTLVFAAPGPDLSPKVGEKSPDFELPSGRATVGLKDFAGKKKVLLTFFPAAFTGG
jgi:AhpC/TSA family